MNFPGVFFGPPNADLQGEDEFKVEVEKHTMKKQKKIIFYLSFQDFFTQSHITTVLEGTSLEEWETKNC